MFNKVYEELVNRIRLIEGGVIFMAGFLDNIDTSEVKYTENYKPVSKSTTMRVDTDIKKTKSNGIR